MDIIAGLVDQRVRSLVETNAEALSGGNPKVLHDEARMRSRAFVAVAVQALLDIPLELAMDLLTDGTHDLAIDALHVDGVQDLDFDVVLVQGKYRKRLDGEGAFPATEVLKVVRTVEVLCDPKRAIDPLSPLAPTIEEIRSRIRDGYNPRVRVVLCNNGRRWAVDGQAHIDAAGLPPAQVTFEHFNHAHLVELLQTPKPIDETLRLKGKATVEDFDFRRVLVGRMRVAELAALFDRHGTRLLERNIRRYLGLDSNRVNQAVAETLRDERQRGDFYFSNNGVTLTCSKLRYNAMQEDDLQVRVNDLRVISGGQTCVTIQRVLADLDPAEFDNTFVLIRLYELEEDDREVIRAITYATNRQNRRLSSWGTLGYPVAPAMRLMANR